MPLRHQAATYAATRPWARGLLKVFRSVTLDPVMRTMVPYVPAKMTVMEMCLGPVGRGERGGPSCAVGAEMNWRVTALRHAEEVAYPVWVQRSKQEGL